MADLLNTAIGQALNRARTINFEVIWRSVLSDPTFRIWILDLVRQNQLFEKGVDEDGDIIGVYSEFTEIINPEKIAGTPYTLFDTGAFYNSMFIVILKDSFVIDADPIKVDEDGNTTDLFRKYGEGIVGLTKESKTLLSEEFKRRSIIEYKRLLQIN